MNLIWTIITSVIASLTTFFVTTILYQAKKEKKQEKISIFKVLMATRNINDYEAVKALNSIDIVFSDCQLVLSAWHRYRASLRVEGELTEAKKSEISESEKKLFEAMAKNLGYKNITWDIIDKPHKPNWLADTQYGQLSIYRLIDHMMQQKSLEFTQQNNEKM